jgi:hypothetical protein
VDVALGIGHYALVQAPRFEAVAGASSGPLSWETVSVRISLRIRRVVLYTVGVITGLLSGVGLAPGERDRRLRSKALLPSVRVAATTRGRLLAERIGSDSFSAYFGVYCLVERSADRTALIFEQGRRLDGVFVSRDEFEIYSPGLEGLRVYVCE